MPGPRGRRRPHGAAGGLPGGTAAPTPPLFALGRTPQTPGMAPAQAPCGCCVRGTSAKKSPLDTRCAAACSVRWEMEPVWSRRWLIWASAAIVFASRYWCSSRCDRTRCCSGRRTSTSRAIRTCAKLSRENLTWMFTDTAHMRRYTPAGLAGLGARSRVVRPDGRVVSSEQPAAARRNARAGIRAVVAAAAGVAAGAATASPAARSRREPGALLGRRASVAGRGVAWASGRIYCQDGVFRPARPARLPVRRAGVGTRRYGHGLWRRWLPSRPPC